MNTRRLDRPLAVLVLIVLWAAVPAAAQGILGRVRDRARQAVTPNRQPATCSPSDYNRAVNTEVSDDAVTRYLRAMQARTDEMRHLAQDNSDQGRYFAAVLLRDSLARRHAMFRRHVGPDWARYQQLQSAPPSTDASVNMRNFQAMGQVERSIDESQVQLPNLDWNTQQSANGHLDDVARQAGNFGICDWTVLVDIVPQVTQALSDDRSQGRPERAITDFQIGRSSGLHQGELRAIRAHAADLAQALAIDYPSDADLAAAQAQRAQQDSAQNAMAAWQACRQRAMGPAGNPMAGMNQDSMRAWAAQAEDARKRGDQATMMAIAAKMQAAMMPGMMQQGMAMQQAQQQCGPMPGTPK